MGNANSKPEVMAIPTPFRNQPRDLGPHLHGHPYRCSRWVVTRKRIVKQDQKTVAGKAFYSALKLVDQNPKRVVILSQNRDDLFWVSRFGKGREAT